MELLHGEVCGVMCGENSQTPSNRCDPVYDDWIVDSQAKSLLRSDPIRRQLKDGRPRKNLN